MTESFSNIVTQNVAKERDLVKGLFCCLAGKAGFNPRVHVLQELNNKQYKESRLSKIYLGESRNTYDICLVALFEGIEVEDLVINRIDTIDEIDDEVKYYFEKG